MAWRNQGITGSNNIPLGRRRFAGDEGGEEDDSRTATPSSMPDGPKRGRSPVRGEFSYLNAIPESVLFSQFSLITNSGTSSRQRWRKAAQEA
jgi:hypothetical protein